MLNFSALTSFTHKFEIKDSRLCSLFACHLKVSNSEYFSDQSIYVPGLTPLVRLS